jgi:cell division protein FtsQ
MGLLVALLSGALAWATHTPLFAIRTIEVQGNVLTSKEQVLRTAGVRIGSNLLLPIARGVRERVQRMPAVMDVEVERELPNTLVIRVTEREPWAAIEAGGSFVAVDKSLRVLARVACPRTGFPLLILQDSTARELPLPGSTIHSSIILAGMACIRRTSESDYGIKIPRVFVDVSHNICLNVNNLGVARLGRAERLGAKLATLRTIVLGSPGLLRKSHFVDLQNPDAPAYSPQEEEPPAGSAPGALND